MTSLQEIFEAIGAFFSAIFDGIADALYSLWTYQFDAKGLFEEFITLAGWLIVLGFVGYVGLAILALLDKTIGYRAGWLLGRLKRLFKQTG